MGTKRDIHGIAAARSPALRTALALCRCYAQYNRPVVFVGPVGAGKTTLAEELWRSMRPRGPWQHVSAGELAENLFRDALFGHVLGAFTGATATREGAIAKASGGVLLLDDLALLPLKTQSAILRVLESGRYRPLGTESEQQATCRFLFATTAEPRELVREGRMLRDLESRLGEFIIRVPSLADRPESILPHARSFAEAFLREHNEPDAVRFSDAARRLLLGYAWPGNLRELASVTEVAVAHAGVRDGVVEIEAVHFPERFRLRSPAANGESPRPKLTEGIVRAAVEEADGNQSEAARRLGYHRNALRRYLAPPE